MSLSHSGGGKHKLGSVLSQHGGFNASTQESALRQEDSEFETSSVCWESSRVTSWLLRHHRANLPFVLCHHFSPPFPRLAIPRTLISIGPMPFSSLMPWTSVKETKSPLSNPCRVSSKQVTIPGFSWLGRKGKKEKDSELSYVRTVWYAYSPTTVETEAEGSPWIQT